MATANETESVRNLTYRELQALAISLDIPGNLKQDVMISLIEAKKSGDEEAVKSILLSHKNLQMRKRMTETPRINRRGRGGRRGGGIGRNTLPALVPYPQYQNGLHRYHMNYLYNLPPAVQDANGMMNFPHMPTTCFDTLPSGSSTPTAHNYQMQVNMGLGQMQEASPTLPLRPQLPQTSGLSPPSSRQKTLPPISPYTVPDSTEVYNMVQRMYSPQSTLQQSLPVDYRQQTHSSGNYLATKDHQQNNSSGNCLAGKDRQQIHSPGNYLANKDLHQNHLSENYLPTKERQKIHSPGNYMANKDLQQNNSSGNYLSVRDLTKTHPPGNYFTTKDCTNSSLFPQSESYLSSVLTPSSTVDSGVDSPDVYHERHSNQPLELSSCCYAGHRHGFQDMQNNMHMRQQDSNNNLSMNMNIIAQNTAMLRQLQMQESSHYQPVTGQYFQHPTNVWNHSSSIGNTTAATTSTFSAYSMEPICSTSRQAYSPQNSDTVSIAESLPSVDNLLPMANCEQVQTLPQASIHQDSLFPQQQQQLQKWQHQQQEQDQGLTDLCVITSEPSSSSLSSESDTDSIKESNTGTQILTQEKSDAVMEAALECKPLKLKTADLIGCRFHKHGCHMQLDKSDIGEHERCCTFQNISCPLILCLWHGALYRLSTHVFQAHGGDIVQTNERRIQLSLHQLTAHSRLQFLQSVSGRIFLITVACVNDTIFANVQYIDEGKDGRSFAILEMLRSNGKTKHWHGPVRAYHEGTSCFTKDYFLIAKLDDVMRTQPFILHAKVAHFVKKGNEEECLSKS